MSDFGERYEVLSDGPGKRAVMQVEPDRLRFERADGEVLTLTRDRFPEVAEVHDGTLVRRMLVVREGARRAFALPPRAFAALRGWIGADSKRFLRPILKRRIRWRLIIGVVFLTLALPLPELTSEVGGEEPFAGHRWLWVALGASALAIGALPWVWPSHYVYLLDGLWSLGFATGITYLVATGEWGHFWLVLVVFEAFQFMAAVRQRQFWSPKGPALE